MITLKEVEKAQCLVGTKYLPMSQTEKQLKLSLEVYLGRGEYDGTLDKAIECLTMAGYEIEGVKNGEV
jgi:hypothetical protein